MRTTKKKERVSDGLADTLSKNAFALYNKALDDFGTIRRGFLLLDDLRRLGNWMAGGPGTLLQSIDFVWLGCVQGEQSVKSFFSDRLQNFVAEKMNANKYLKPHEIVCRETIFNERSLEEVLLEMGVSKESIEPKLLLKQLDAEILDFLIHPDGKRELCGFCNESMPKFQPVESFIIKREGNLDTNLKRRAVEDAIFCLKGGLRATAGSFVAVRKDNEDGYGYHLVAVPFHGPHSYFDQDEEMMYRKIRDNLVKGHIGKARKKAYVQQEKSSFKNVRIKRPGMALAVSRTNIEKFISTSQRRRRWIQEDEVSQTKMDEIFPSSKLTSGLGPTSKG